MPQPIVDLGPFTPRHCTVCGAPIPQVEDSNSGVRKWARHLNYMDHLKKYHLEYYKWSKRWTNSFYLPLIPFFILAYISEYERSQFLLLVTVAVTVTPYIPLFLYRSKSVHAFREAWNRSGGFSERRTEYANSDR